MNADIFPDVIAGTSAGALTGVLYAMDILLMEILKIMNATASFIICVRQFHVKASSDLGHCENT